MTKSFRDTVAAGLLIASLVGATSFYNEVKANTSQNVINKAYNLKFDKMNETIIRIDENVKHLRELNEAE